MTDEAKTARLLAGTFVLDEDYATVHRRIERAIEAAIADVSFVLRPFVRSRLRGKNPVRKRVRVELAASHVVVVYDDERYQGEEDSWREVQAGGEALRMLVERSGRSMIFTFRTEDGEKRTVHTVSKDGVQLSLDITVTSSRLPTPLAYRVSFRRAGPGEMRTQSE